jgi:hypothetical protein
MAEEAQLQALARQVERLQSRLHDQERRLTAYEGQHGGPGGAQDGRSLVRKATRRDLFKFGGAAAGAAGLAAMAGIQRPQPADAAFTLNGGGISAADGETLIKAGSGTSGEPSFSGNDSVLLLDASSNPQTNKDLRGLHAYGSGVLPSIEGIGGVGNGAGVVGRGGGNQGQGVVGVGAGGVFANFLNQVGVHGFGGGGSEDGVRGNGGSSNGIGVRGTGTGQGVGVAGQGGQTSGLGVSGQGGSPNGKGAVFDGTGTGAQLQLYPKATAGPPGSGNHDKGDVWLDTKGILWVCINAVFPSVGTWARIGAVNPSFGAQSNTGGVMNFLPNPIRLLINKYNGGSTHTLQVAGATDLNGTSVVVPVGALGVIGNVAVNPDPGPDGFLTLFPTGSPQPNTNNISYKGGGGFLDNFAIVGLGGGNMDIYVKTTTQVYFDATGFVI